MYKLVKFILKYHFVILFVLLELLAISIIIQNNQYQKVKFLNSANTITGTILETQSSITDYLHLAKVNAELAEENAALRKQMLEVNYVKVPTLYNDTLFRYDTLIIDTAARMPYYAARVISNSINKQFNIVYINKGSHDRIQEDMGVVNSDGIVGIVRNVSANYAVVTPIINRNFNINAKIKGSGFFGNLSWDGKDPSLAQLYDIPNHISPNIGDTIVSSGYSHIFEEGYTIGYVHEVHAVPGKSFINLDVKLAVEFGNLNYVYGIENTIQNHTDSLDLAN